VSANSFLLRICELIRSHLDSQNSSVNVFQTGQLIIVVVILYKYTFNVFNLQVSFLYFLFRQKHLQQSTLRIFLLQLTLTSKYYDKTENVRIT